MNTRPFFLVLAFPLVGLVGVRMHGMSAEIISLKQELLDAKADEKELRTNVSTLTKENTELKERDRWCEIHTTDLPVIRARLDARQGNGYDYLEAFNEATKDIRPDRSGP